MKSTGTSGTNAVDWEQRVDFDRLRDERLARLKGQLATSDLGAVLAFDFSNIRYMSSTHIGTWAMDKLIRFALLTRNTDPIVWDFGSAAKHHALYNPWLDVTLKMDADPHSPHEGAKATSRIRRTGGISTSAARSPDAAMATDLAKVKRELEKFGVAKNLGGRVIELPVLFALQRRASRSSTAAGLHGSTLHQDDRRNSTPHQAASMVDALTNYRFLRPGVRENRLSVWSPRRCTTLAPESRASPRSQANGVPIPCFRTLDPTKIPFFDIFSAGTAIDVLLPHLCGRPASSKQRDAYTRARSTSTVRSQKSSLATWRTSCGVAEAGVRLRGRGGLRAAVRPRRRPVIWEKPIFSRLTSLDHPELLEEGMVFALETYWPSADGWGAARIEEEVVVTADGCEVITKFPAEELIVAGRQYYTVNGPLNLNRDSQSHLNTSGTWRA